ncbi:MAG: agmatine deiminase family protein [Vulcanimicrobiaceae bacterium]
MPAEWSPHAATWVAWPSDSNLWEQNLGLARAAFARLVAAVAEGETAEVLVPDEAQEERARATLPEKNVRFHRVPFGDIWLRDTGPLFLVGDRGASASVRFAFNGWGGKYDLPDDDRVAERIAAIAAVPCFREEWVLEGGAVDVDGEGSVLTTRQCMLHANRNGVVGEREVETVLRRSLGVDKVLWLGAGLLNDHTDGHVDTVVRFVRPGVVVAMESRTADDPNRDTLRALVREAEALSDVRGQKLDVVRIPSPGRIVDSEGRIMPASYANFYITNANVVVPTYGAPSDDEAVESIGALFPGRRSIGIDARALLTGGGALHCITQQQPRTSP